jgi:hypothetical protein
MDGDFGKEEIGAGEETGGEGEAGKAVDSIFFGHW